MSRPLRIEFAGALYHALNRGNARQTVFRDDTDHEAFRDLLGETCLRFDWHCHAHCLMPNHYHLLIETRAPTLSRGMRHLNGVFTQRFNQRHARVGHLFQGRFKAILVQHERYLLELARYIVLNPVRAKLVASAAQWRWSSHAWSTGAARAPAWAMPDAIWSRLGGDAAAAMRAFQDYIGAAHGQPSVGWSSDGVLGDDGFKLRQRSAVASKRQIVEMPNAMRIVDRPALSTLLEGRWSRGCPTLDRQIEVAIDRWRYTQADVARHLGVSRTTVAKAMARTRSLQKST